MGRVTLFKISVDGIRCAGIHGVLESEKARAQPFLVDIECTLERDERADALETTVDYGWLVSIAQAVISTESYQLLETLAQRIATHCLIHELITEIRVRVHKPQGPLAEHIADSWAEVRLAK